MWPLTFTNDVFGADTGTATAAESGIGTAQSQFPRKSVNLFFMLVLIKDELTDLCGNWLFTKWPYQHFMWEISSDPRRKPQVLGGCRVQSVSHSMYYSDDLRKSTPSQKRQLDTSISNSKQQVDDFVGELTFWNYFINTLCEMKVR